MKKYLFCALFALGVNTLSAYPHPCPEEWSFYAEFLYLRPSVDDTFFVASNSVSSPTPAGSVINNDFRYQPGFRVGGVYALCHCNQQIRIDYARLNIGQKKTVSGGFLYATNGSTGFPPAFTNYTGNAISDLSLLYQRVDAMFMQGACLGSCIDAYFQGGLEYAYARFHELYTYQSAANIGYVQPQGKTWGIGPQAGADFSYCLGNLVRCWAGKLYLKGTATGSLLISKSVSQDTDTLNGALTLNVQADPTWRIVPAFHGRVGFSYSTCVWACMDAALELGYEFNSYIRMLTRTTAPTNFTNFDIHGLYLGLDLTF